MAGLIIIAIIGLFLCGLTRSTTDQPLAFNHRIHAENGTECSDCHQLYREHASSGRPTLTICSSCHSEPLGQSESEKLLRQYILKGEEIPWNRLYRLPADVYFSHRRHVVFGKVECQACHGNIGQSSSPPSRALNISMEKCLDCHRKNNVDQDCLTCHR